MNVPRHGALALVLASVAGAACLCGHEIDGLDGRDGEDGGDGPLYEGDAGTCRIGDSGAIAAGTWLTIDYGSCVVCDPSVNAEDWTILGDGHVCDYLALPANGAATITVPGGVCDSQVDAPFGTCVAYGGGCVQASHLPCYGGFCGDAGYCELDRNDLGMLTQCWNGDEHPNICAEGPCCMDAGWGDIAGGGGWCCGLIDGGVKTCVPWGAVCDDSSDCCDARSCLGHSAVYESDAGYGFCR